MSATATDAHPPAADPALLAQLATATTRADAAERARDQAEADRDRWQAIATQLADARRFRWPWSS